MFGCGKLRRRVSELEGELCAVRASDDKHREELDVAWRDYRELREKYERLRDIPEKRLARLEMKCGKRGWRADVSVMEEDGRVVKVLTTPMSSGWGSGAELEGALRRLLNVGRVDSA